MGTTAQFQKEKLREVSFSEVVQYQRRAAKERVSIKPSSHTRWFIYDSDVAVIGLMFKPEGDARIKGVWVSPEYRRFGIGSAMTEEVMRMVEELGGRSIDVYAHNPAFYIQRGFSVCGTNAQGVARLIKVIR